MIFHYIRNFVLLTNNCVLTHDQMEIIDYNNKLQIIITITILYSLVECTLKFVLFVPCHWIVVEMAQRQLNIR